MRLAIPIDFSGSPIPPEIYLCTTGGSVIGQLPAYSISGTFKWNTYSEITFSVDRVFVDTLTGESKINTLFDKIEGPRQVLVQGVGMFLIQDVDTSYSDKDTKNVTCFSAEYSLSTKYLSSFHINTGEVDSKEVIYESSKYPEGAKEDDMYKLANYGNWDCDQTYFHRVYVDSDDYNYEPILVNDEDDYETHFGTDVHPEDILYIHGFANVKFYDPNNKELSLLHLILEENAPEWSIRNVNNIKLRYKERKLSEDYISIYDLLTNTVADIFGCVFVFDTINKQIDVYAEENDGLTDDGVINPLFETDVYISRDNLASEVSVKMSTDTLRTRLKVSGADGLDIREVNLGQNYIMNLDYYHNDDWMEQDLIEAYQSYLDAVKKYSPQYETAMQGWVAANDKYNELMNAVPVEGNVVLVGDEFKKLYCVYAPINTAYCNGTLNVNTMIPDHSPIGPLYSDSKFTTTIEAPNNGDEFVVQGLRVKYIPEIAYYSDTLDASTLEAEVSTVDSLYSDVDCTVKIESGDLINGKQFVVQGLLFNYSSKNNNFVYSKNYSFTYMENLIPNSITTLIGTEDNYKSGKLYLYSVHEDTEKNKNDNILLTLKNANSDKATIRIYNNGTKDVPEYLIQSLIVSAATGTAMAAKTYTMQQWVSGELTADLMELKGYTISSIGTMGAYLVLAKDEKEEAVLEEYGINLLQTKHDTYVKIFQTQTEAMYSQQDYQCIVQNEQPTGEYDNGTKWLDTNSSPVKLYEYNKDDKTWREINANKEVSASDEKNYRNYQRYLDNYNKMVAVQNMLIKKKKEAEYWAYGQQLDNPIVYIDGDGDNKFYRAADAYFRTSSDPDYAVIITGGTLSHDLITTYTFTTPKADGKFVIYLDGTTPYLMHLNSQGYWDAKKNAIVKKTEFSSFFTPEQWAALSPLIREDEYTDDNFLLTTYESEEERLEICKTLMEEANKELKTLSQPSLEFSMTMANILALPEFEPFVRSYRIANEFTTVVIYYVTGEDGSMVEANPQPNATNFNEKTYYVVENERDSSQFALGNFIRIELRPGIVKRARLLECTINFDNLSDFSCVFGNLITTKSEIDLHAELLSQAITAGKTVATAAGTWQAAADKANKLEESIASGLQDVTLQIGRASGQAQTWGPDGLYFRKFKDGSTEEYDDQQIAIINNKLVFTNDGWKTSKAALGQFDVDTNGDGVKEQLYGLIAEAMVGGYIKGSVIEGGSLKIGDETIEGGNLFVVNPDGSVEIKSNGQDKYASKNAISVIDNAYKYTISLTYTNSTIFNNTEDFCEVACEILDYGNNITDQVVAQENSVFTWSRNSGDKTSDSTWKPTYNGAKNKIIIKTSDVIKNSQFFCSVEFDETNIII